MSAQVALTGSTAHNYLSRRSPATAERGLIIHH